MSYYKVMLEYLKTHSSFNIDLINRNKYLITCVISYKGDDESHLIIEVFHKHNRKFTIMFDRNRYTENEEVLKSIFEIIEKQTFCNNEFCNLITNSDEDIINEICFRCAFYADYNKSLEDSDCSICLEKNNIHSIHLRCNHIFHKKCLHRSCESACLSHYTTKCPLCRIELHFNNAMNQLSTGQDCLDFME